jgi:hypothetical protein
MLSQDRNGHGVEIDRPPRMGARLQRDEATAAVPILGPLPALVLFAATV